MGIEEDGEFHLCKHKPSHCRYLVHETDVLFNKYMESRDVRVSLFVHLLCEAPGPNAFLSSTH